MSPLGLGGVRLLPHSDKPQRSHALKHTGHSDTRQLTARTSHPVQTTQHVAQPHAGSSSFCSSSSFCFLLHLLLLLSFLSPPPPFFVSSSLFFVSPPFFFCLLVLLPGCPGVRGVPGCSAVSGVFRGVRFAPLDLVAVFLRLVMGLLITSNCDTLKTCEQAKAYVNEQVVLRRDKQVKGLVPMDVDALAGKIIAVARVEGSGGTPAGWTWPEEGCTGAAWQGKGPGDGHRATGGTSSLHFADDVTEDTDKLADKLEEIMSFVSSLGQGKGGKGKGGKRDVQCWHCGKVGHVAAECWQMVAAMEQYRASKGKGKAKGSSKGEWEETSKGSWSKSSWKRKGKKWRTRKGTYWFDQTTCSSSDGDRAWAFSVEARTAQDSSECEPEDLLQA